MQRLGLILLILVLAACSLSTAPEVTPTIGPPPFTRMPSRTPANFQPTDEAPPSVTPLPNANDVIEPASEGIPTVVPTIALQQPLPPTVIAVSLTAGDPIAPQIRAFALSTNGGLQEGEIALPGDAIFIDYNPINPARYARIDSFGMLHFVAENFAEGVYSFPPYFEGFSTGSAEENKLFMAEVAWSPNGQMLAFRIDSGDPEANDGVWFWQPARELATDPSYHLLRDCPPGCNLVIRQNAQEWQSRSLEWSSDNQAILVGLDLPDAGRRGLTILQAIRDPETKQSRTGPNVLYYDYGHWASDGQRIIVSGHGPDGQVVFGSINRDGSNELLHTAATIDLGWVQDAVHQPERGQIILLGSPGSAGGALKIYDSNGTALTDFIGNAPPLHVKWSPDRNAVLVTTDEGGSLRYYVAQIDGTITDITTEVGSTTAINWVAGSLPANARVQGPYIPSGVVQGSAYQPGQQLRVYVDELTIYPAPSTAQEPVGTVGKGEYVAILAGPVEAEDIQWWRVQTFNYTGWLSGRIGSDVTLGP